MKKTFFIKNPERMDLSSLDKYVLDDGRDYENCMRQKEKILSVEMQYVDKVKVFENCFLIYFSGEPGFEKIDLVLWEKNPPKVRLTYNWVFR